MSKPISKIMSAGVGSSGAIVAGPLARAYPRRLLPNLRHPHRTISWKCCRDDLPHPTVSAGGQTTEVRLTMIKKCIIIPIPTIHLAECFEQASLRHRTDQAHTASWNQTHLADSAVPTYEHLQITYGIPAIVPGMSSPELRAII